MLMIFWNKFLLLFLIFKVVFIRVDVVFRVDDIVFRSFVIDGGCCVDLV